MNFRIEYVSRYFGREVAERASYEVARGRPSSGGYWLNKTKDFSESLGKSWQFSYSN